MDSLTLLIVGPGRAGMSLAMASRAAGHRIAGVVGRSKDHAAAAADALGTGAHAIGDELPAADLAVIAVSDDAIAPVAELLARGPIGFAAAVHVSGLASIDVLGPLADRGVAVGSFHPLQTLPTPEAGAARLAGAAVAVTATEPLATTLFDLARSLGAEPFHLDDADKAVYHAAAAAAANFPVVPLAMAKDLFAAAGVDFALARPLVEAMVANVFAMGPRAALTGPVARGDVATVAGQLAAVAERTPEWSAAYVDMVGELARLTGRRDRFEDLLSGGDGS